MKHKELIDQMSLEEKAAFLGGKNEWQSHSLERLQIPSIFFSDGPHGIRKQAGTGDHLGLNPSLPATCFPTAATVANSWDEELGEAIGKALGEEAGAQGVHVLLGPGLNMKRSPLCGRNFEYFSEDPYLAGKMAAAYVRGIQSQGVRACPKHFAVNSQETRRMAMNAIIDERTMRELYLTGFEIAVKEGGAKAIMSSYNEINGVYANENPHLLQEILRDEWGFDGLVVTDWGASNSHTEGVRAGSTLEMPGCGYDSARELVAAVKEGRLKEEDLNLRVDELLDAALEVKEAEASGSFSEQEHHQLARRAAAESIVLLKNKEEILPLKKDAAICVIGDFAFQPRYQGAGSSMVNPTRLDTISEKISEYPVNCIGMARGYERNGEQNDSLIKDALEFAKKADVVLYCFGLNEISESEGSDRTHMRVPQNQLELLESLAKVNENVIGVLSAGSSVEMPWQYCCKAIVHGYLGGQAGAAAMLDVLTGRVNPSGRLNETYPVRYEDTPAFRYFPGVERDSEYREGLYIGYRYYDTSRVRVQYPFGYGLSYTTFEYKKMSVTDKGVTFLLKNTGNRDGAEVAQLYVGCWNGKIFRPEKELKGFKKVFLKAGETKEVTIPFDDKTFRYWNALTNRWEIEGGTYQLLVGACVMDIRLSSSITLEGSNAPLPYGDAELTAYRTGLVQNVSKEEYEHLLGRKAPENKWSGELGLNDAVCQMYYAKSKTARLIYKKLTEKKRKSEQEGKPDLNLLFIYNIPFRGIAKMTGGIVSMRMAEGLVTAVNGRLFKGLGIVISGYFKNRRENKRYKKLLNYRI